MWLRFCQPNLIDRSIILNKQDMSTQAQCWQNSSRLASKFGLEAVRELRILASATILASLYAWNWDGCHQSSLESDIFENNFPLKWIYWLSFHCQMWSFIEIVHQILGFVVLPEISENLPPIKVQHASIPWENFFFNSWNWLHKQWKYWNYFLYMHYLYSRVHCNRFGLQVSGYCMNDLPNQNWNTKLAWFGRLFKNNWWLKVCFSSSWPGWQTLYRQPKCLTWKRLKMTPLNN